METKKISAAEYLKHCYTLPPNLLELPLPDEDFVRDWNNTAGNAGTFLSKKLGVAFSDFKWYNPTEITIFFAETLGGKLPVIATQNHKDFLNVEAILNGRNNLLELPLTVNAFTISAKNKNIRGQRLILLNRAPYSNIPAKRLNLRDAEWLELSHILRLRHECAHYETLRIFGSMKNHALDEILADATGQLAAFGNFSSARQKLFFGLQGDKCTGRLTFYCRKVENAEQSKIFAAVDKVLDIVEEKINTPQKYFERLKFLACTSIEEILKSQS